MKLTGSSWLLALALLGVVAISSVVLGGTGVAEVSSGTDTPQVYAEVRVAEVGGAPSNLVVRPEIRWDWALDSESPGSIAVIDAEGNVLGHLPLGGGATAQFQGLAALGDILFATNFADDKVFAVDAILTFLVIDFDSRSDPFTGDVSNDVSAIIAVGDGPRGIAANPDTNLIYVANFFGGSLSVIDVQTLAVTDTIALGGSPNGVAVNLATGRIYVSDFSGDRVRVVDGATNGIVATIPVGDGPDGLTVDRETGFVYVANLNSGTMSVIDGATNVVIATVAVGAGANDVAVNPLTDRVFVANFDDDTVSVIDRSTNEVIATVEVGDGPDAVAVFPSAGFVHVANHDDGTVSIIADPPPRRSVLWTDVNCNGVTDSVDALLVQRHVAGLPVNQEEPCPDIGSDIEVTQNSTTVTRKWGDADCNGMVDAIDALKKLRQVVGLAVSQDEPCPGIGSTVEIPAA